MVKLLLSALRWAGVFGLNLGGGGNKTPKSTTQTVVSDVPEYARGYVKETLAKGMELTNQPYEAYGGNRLAGFSDLQNQSFTGAQNLGVSPQIGQATDYATQSGQYSPVGQQYTGSNVNQYMNPYLQGALAPQLREAATAGMMAQQQNASKAVGMGAFGGSRGALQQSLTEKNTMQNMADINARGYSDAFNQAANMFNIDQQRRIQEAQFGNQARLSAAQQLGQLGQLQFNQGLSAAELQNKFGAQQQGQTQRGLDIAYDDFNREKNFDYEQIMRKSDLLRSVPSGSSSTTSMYGSNPSTAQNLAATGMAAYGASRLFARGGLAYAGGGVTDEQYVEGEIIPSLSNDQLQTAYGIAMQTGDIGRANAIAEVLQSRGVPMEGGAMEPQVAPNSISAMATPDMVDNIMPTQASMANGGIVAFADGDLVEEFIPRVDSPGNAALFNMFGQEALDVYERQKALKAPVALTRAERAKAAKEYYDELKTMGGEGDPYADIRKKISDREKTLGERTNEDKAFAAFAAAREMVSGGRKPIIQAGLEGLGAGSEAYQKSQAARDEQRSAIEEMQFQLAKAQQLEERGLYKEAAEAVRAAEAAKLAAYNAEKTGLQGQLTGLSSAAKAFRPVSSGGSGSGPQIKVAEQLAAAEIAYRMNPSPENKLKVEALRDTNAQIKTSLQDPARTVLTLRENAEKRVDANILFMGGPLALERYAKAKGITPAQARQKMIDDNLSDEQVQQIMKEYKQGSDDDKSATQKEPPAGFKLDKPN